MTTLEMADSSAPPPHPAPVPVYAFYAGGQTPHAWTPADIKTITSRWGLPIWVCTDPAAAAAAIAADYLAWLRDHDWQRGTTVALDHENVPLGAVISDLSAILDHAGYRLLDYQSKDIIPGEPATTGGLWVPDWTGIPHMYPGAAATQYADSEMLGLPWDGDLIDAAVPLHQLNPPAVHKIPQVTVSATVPELARGDTGPAVRRVQHLILAWNPAELPAAGPDGIFGPETVAALRSFQRVYGITADAGTVTAETWIRLITG